jgi:hypothetical protein
VFESSFTETCTERLKGHGVNGPEQYGRAQEAGDLTVVSLQFLNRMPLMVEVSVDVTMVQMV